MTKEVKTMRQNVKLKNRATLTNTVKIIILRMGMIKEKWLETRPTPRPIPSVVVPESPSDTILSVIMDPNCVFVEVVAVVVVVVVVVVARVVVEVVEEIVASIEVVALSVSVMFELPVKLVLIGVVVSMVAAVPFSSEVIVTVTFTTLVVLFVSIVVTISVVASLLSKVVVGFPFVAVKFGASVVCIVAVMLFEGVIVV